MTRFSRATTPLFLLAILFMGCVGGSETDADSSDRFSAHADLDSSQSDAPQTAVADVADDGATAPQRAAAPKAIATFESIGIHWNGQPTAAGGECVVRYRVEGTENWREAMPLWFDRRDRQYRGTIVGLEPGRRYEIQLKVRPADDWTPLTAETWPEAFPVVKTVYVESSAEPLVIREGGTPGGYVLYTARPGEIATIDVADQHRTCVSVRASYVIVRGLVLKSAQRNGIELGDVTDVVIERCDISGWGRRDKNFGKNFDSGIKSSSESLERIVVQRNKIHHPRYGANNWTQMSDDSAQGYHPLGPQGISWGDNAGNHVIRYNEIYSDDEHRFNDGMGWWNNFSRGGFPGPDSDVYGNIVTHCWDDGLEIEGGGRNVRVWGNYIDQTMVGIATCATSVGPLYVFRNVFARSQWTVYPGGDTDAPVRPGHRKRNAAPILNRGGFGKLGEMETGGSGRQYWLHNTMLQPAPGPGKSTTLGARYGLQSAGKSGMITELVSLNNIWHVCHSRDRKRVNRHSVFPNTDSATNVFDYDLYNGTILEAYRGAEEHGIRGVPVYAPGHGPEAGAGGLYQLDAASPGYDAGKRIPNFNDGFVGAAPDMGAHEHGSPRMEFGVDAYLDRTSSDS